MKRNARALAALPGEIRSRALTQFAEIILERQEEILRANVQDYTVAKADLAPELRSRLSLDAIKLAVVREGILQLASIQDPLGKELAKTTLDDGLILHKVRVPLGAVGVIFESRPDVMPQLLSLALRTGNGIVLKGGREAAETNRAFMRCVEELSKRVPELPSPWALFVEGREVVEELLSATDALDLIIPRGSKELVQTIIAKSKVPVLGHADGVCHLYIHRSAELASALAILIDSKTQYPAACNATECALIDREIASAFLPLLAKKAKEVGLTLRGCSKTLEYLPGVALVRDDEWSTEYGTLTLALKVVSGVGDAIDHINRYGSHHTDGIVATDSEAIQEFERGVDSASVLSNCSTRFADGFRYGFGAEIGISTGKIHARGPVGIEGLLTYQYRVHGSGHLVSSYVGKDAKHFLHRKEF